VKFIYADSLDFVDPGYNFENDSYSPSRQPYWDDVFAHELLAVPPYDGLLVSRALLGGGGISGRYSQAQSMRFRREGARRFLRLDKEKTQGLLLFGDCGAFSYREMEEPPYKPRDMIEFYEESQFTHGCSIDHIIFEFSVDGKPSEDARNRFELTLALAEEFFREHQSQGAQFTPIGVVQGWSPESMARAAKTLTKIGYRYLAIGGLVPLQINAIRKAVSAIHHAVKGVSGVRLHLLGFAKAEHIEEFRGYGVASFDSTSPLIRAFKDRTRNYWQLSQTKALDYFSAIRVPQANDNLTLKNRVKRGEVSQEELMESEKMALQTLRSYDNNEAYMEETLDNIINYSRYLLDSPSMEKKRLEKNLDELRNLYQKTLEAMPWKHCCCAVCKDCSIEVVIFRASNRNKRRGMHNLHVFHKYIGQIQGNVS
jgi:hypothetical protein